MYKECKIGDKKDGEFYMTCEAVPAFSSMMLDSNLGLLHHDMQGKLTLSHHILSEIDSSFT